MPELIRESRKQFPLYMPLSLWRRLVAHLQKWGTVTPFIVAAIEEKLDREEKPNKTA